MNEQMISAEFLSLAKAGMKNYASAISETCSPDVRNTLRKHLDDTICLHEKLTEFVIKKGYYNAQDPQQQIKMDMQAADTALNLK